LGSIAAVQKRLSQTLAEPVTALCELLEQELVSLVDETSWREKQAKPWLWVKATKRATVFLILPGRSQKDAKIIIGKNASGFVTSDRYPFESPESFGKTQGCNRAESRLANVFGRRKICERQNKNASADG